MDLGPRLPSSEPAYSAPGKGTQAGLHVGWGSQGPLPLALVKALTTTPRITWVGVGCQMCALSGGSLQSWALQVCCQGQGQLSNGVKSMKNLLRLLSICPLVFNPQEALGFGDQKPEVWKVGLHGPLTKT